jgi:hypothetical protein
MRAVSGRDVLRADGGYFRVAVASAEQSLCGGRVIVARLVEDWVRLWREARRWFAAYCLCLCHVAATDLDTNDLPEVRGKLKVEVML